MEGKSTYLLSDKFQENRKSVIIHIVELYGDQFKSIETYGVVEQISRRYAQYHDTSGVVANSGTEAIDRLVSPQILLISQAPATEWYG